MVNVTADDDLDPRDRQAEALAAVPGAHLHLYGKSARPGRKIGHVTVLGDDREESRRDARVAADTLVRSADDAESQDGVGESSP